MRVGFGGDRGEEELLARAYLKPVSERPSAFSWSAHANQYRASEGVLLSSGHGLAQAQQQGAAEGGDAAAAMVGRLVATAARAHAIRQQMRASKQPPGKPQQPPKRRLDFGADPPAPSHVHYGQSVVRGPLSEPRALSSSVDLSTSSFVRGPRPVAQAMSSAPPSVLSRSFPGSAAAAARAGLALPPAIVG